MFLYIHIIILSERLNRPYRQLINDLYQNDDFYWIGGTLHFVEMCARRVSNIAIAPQLAGSYFVIRNSIVSDFQVNSYNNYCYYYYVIICFDLITYDLKSNILLLNYTKWFPAASVFSILLSFDNAFIEVQVLNSGFLHNSRNVPVNLSTAIILFVVFTCNVEKIW